VLDELALTPPKEKDLVRIPRSISMGSASSHMGILSFSDPEEDLASVLCIRAEMADANSVS
jgi:hypothetical protein